MLKILASGTVAGVISGVLLLLACAYVEWIAEIELMTLLLNIDFIHDGDPYFLVEVLLHLVVSVILASMLKWLHMKHMRLYMPAMMGAWLVTSMLYFVLSALAVDPIATNGYIGFTLWAIFHIGYLEVLHLLFRMDI